MVAGPRRDTTQKTARGALGAKTWERVKALARAREASAISGRARASAALRDTAIVVLLGEAGLRNEELLSCAVMTCSPAAPTARARGCAFTARAPSSGSSHYAPKPSTRSRAGNAPVPPSSSRTHCCSPVSDVGAPWARFRRPAARSPGKALTAIVKPIMLAAGIDERLANLHVLRHRRAAAASSPNSSTSWLTPAPRPPASTSTTPPTRSSGPCCVTTAAQVSSPSTNADDATVLDLRARHDRAGSGGVLGRRPRRDAGQRRREFGRACPASPWNALPQACRPGSGASLPPRRRLHRRSRRRVRRRLLLARLPRASPPRTTQLGVVDIEARSQRTTRPRA